MGKVIYAWIASVARLVPEATFHEADQMRDGACRIMVRVGKCDRVFLVAACPYRCLRELDTPEQVRAWALGEPTPKGTR